MNPVTTAGRNHAQLLDVDLDLFAGPAHLDSPDHPTAGAVHQLQALEPVPDRDLVAGRDRQAGSLGEIVGAQLQLLPKTDHLSLELESHSPQRAMWLATPVGKAVDTLAAKPPPPDVHGCD